MVERLVIVVVDDDEAFRRRLCRAFRDRGCESYEAGTREEVLRLATGVSPDLVLLDLKMPGLSGLDLIPEIKKLDSTIAILILTGYGSIPTAMQALKLGADHYMGKPVDIWVSP
jgi:two-component system response regulator RegA